MAFIHGGDKQLQRDWAAIKLYKDYYPGKFEEKKYNTTNLYGDYYPGKYISQQPLPALGSGSGNGSGGSSGGGSGGGSGNGSGGSGGGSGGSGSGGLPTYAAATPPVSPYAEMLSQLEKAKAERERRLQAAKQTQLGAVDQQYNSLAQQAYIQKMQAMQNLPTQLALTGQTGGMSETATLAPQLAYGNALDAYGRDRASQAAQINAAIDERSLNTAEDYDNQIYNLRAAEAQQAYENQLAAQKARNDYATELYRAQLETEQKNVNPPSPLPTPTPAAESKVRVDAAKRALGLVGYMTREQKIKHLDSKGFTSAEIAAAIG